MPALHQWCRDHSGDYLLLPRTTVAQIAAYGEVIGELGGFNYSDGAPVDHAIVRINAE